MSRIDDIVVDNTAEFTAPEDFTSLEELMNWVGIVSKSLGVVVIKKRTKFSKKNVLRKIWLMCDRGGEYTHIGSSKDTQTKKIGCPFELVASRNHPPNNSWKLNVVCGIHTHANATNLEGHAFAMRLNDDEKNIVAELTRSHVKPRDILAIIKARNEDNFSSIRNVYNERHKVKTSIYTDNNSMEILLRALEARGFMYTIRKNDDTNELEDLFFCHRMSLGIWQSFPQVLLIDATYKTNRYNMPLVEMVGVTSTNTTFSIAYAVINKEKVQNYVWVLSQLQLRSRYEVHPNVIVTDRDLALMKACTIVFPKSHKLLCRWHIWQNILKNCRPCFNLQAWNSFNHIWEVLVKSPNIDAYHNNYLRLQRFLQDNQVSGHVLAYVNGNWLDQYKERFVSAWCDKYLTFDNNTTNRVESSHAHLKSLLNSSQCKLDQIVERIEDIIKLQHTSIKEKLEKSKIKVSHRLNNTRIFRHLKFKVSSHGLKFFFEELERLNGFDQVTIDNCGCQLRTSCGLPCAHELHFFMMQDLFIPINEIDVFWRTLDIPNVTTEEVDEELNCDAELEKFKKMFADQPKAKKFSLIRTLKGMFDPSSKLVEPAVQKNIRGRPSLKSSKDKQVLHDQIPQQKESRRHSCSMYRPEIQFELNEPPRHSEYIYRDLPTAHSSKDKQVQRPYAFDLNDEPSEDNDYIYQQPESMVNDFFDNDPFMQNLINYQPSQMQEPENSWQYGYNYPESSRHDEFYYEQPPIQDPIRYGHQLIHEIPSFFQPYVIGIEDVVGDGNCGFRAIAVAIGRQQNEWPIIRRELLQELHDNNKQYKIIYGEDYKPLEDSINFCGSGYAPYRHWMSMPNTGQLISNKYNCILYFLTTLGSLTFFPMRSNPQSPEQNQSITIAHVNGNHFVKVDLQEGHPMPDVCAFYKHSKKRENRKIASAWEVMYKDRLLAYKQAQRNVVDPNFIECG